jgi:hypothetical protein
MMRMFDRYFDNLVDWSEVERRLKGVARVRRVASRYAAGNGL